MIKQNKLRLSLLDRRRIVRFIQLNILGVFAFQTPMDQTINLSINVHYPLRVQHNQNLALENKGKYNVPQHADVHTALLETTKPNPGKIIRAQKTLCSKHFILVGMVDSVYHLG
jgi:hypothetical protein